jgi:hypothetical protein
MSSGRPAWIYEGALLFATDISCNCRDSPYKGDRRGTMTEGPRLSRPLGRQLGIDRNPLLCDIATDLRKVPYYMCSLIQLPIRPRMHKRIVDMKTRKVTLVCDIATDVAPLGIVAWYAMSIAVSPQPTIRSLRPSSCARVNRGIKGIIPHHETFSTTIQPPYSSTKG